MRSTSAVAVPALAVCLAAALSACGGGTSSAGSPAPSSAAGTAAAPTTPAAGGQAGAASSGAPDCPDAAPAQFAWPAGVPADLPKPAGAELGSTSTTPEGLTVVRFRTSASLRQGVVDLTRSLQPAGYTLGRGDAEAAEADAPFSRGDLRGIYRMVATQPCSTDWLLAVTSSAGGGPLLPTPTASTSPLPFG